MSVRRVFPEYATLPHDQWFAKAQHWQRHALEKIQRAFDLPLPEFLMLGEIDPFYQELREQEFTYQKIITLSQRFKGNRDILKGKKTGPSPVSLNTLQIQVADAMLGLDGTKVQGGMYEVTRALFPDLAGKTTREVKLVYQAIKAVPVQTYAKIERVWRLSEEAYCKLIAADAWYQKLTARFPLRTPEALALMKADLIRPRAPRRHSRQIASGTPLPEGRMAGQKLPSKYGNLALSQKEIDIADALLGFDDTSAEESFAAIAQRIFPELTTPEALRRAYQRINNIRLLLRHKITLFLAKPPEQVEEIITVHPWYQKLMLAYPIHDPAARECIVERMYHRPSGFSGASRNGHSLSGSSGPRGMAPLEKKLRDKRIFLAISQTPLWDTVSERMQTFITCYYGLDLPEDQMRTGQETAHICGIPIDQLTVRIWLIKRRLKHLDPTIPFNVQPSTQKPWIRKPPKEPRVSPLQQQWAEEKELFLCIAANPVLWEGISEQQREIIAYEVVASNIMFSPYTSAD